MAVRVRVQEVARSTHGRKRSERDASDATKGMYMS